MGGAASTLLRLANPLLYPDVLLASNDEGDRGSDEEFSTIFSEKLNRNHIAFVLEEKKGREAYQTFLKRVFPDADYSRIESMDKDVALGGLRKQSVTGKNPTVADIIDSYERPTECLKAELETVLSTGGRRLSAIPTDTSSDHSATLIALKGWPLFLASEEFQKWKFERRRTVIRFQEEDEVFEETMVPLEEKGQGSVMQNYDVPSIEEIDSEFARIAKDQSWLGQLLTSVESLPLCISVASARKGEKGFPLIYVNNFFEKTTGYKREEILGQNCRFLQRGPKPGQRAQASSIARLSDNLGQGKPVKVVITNYRKDGSAFMNLLALKPIFDSDGEYAFVVGIQFDIGDGNASPDRLQMVERIMTSLPDRFVPPAEKKDSKSSGA